MTGIIINIDPVALRFGDFELRWYSIAILLAVITGIVIAAHKANKKGLKAGDISLLLPRVYHGLVIPLAAITTLAVIPVVISMVILHKRDIHA